MSSIFGKYEDMLSDGFFETGNRTVFQDDDEEEDFVTSKEIVKMHKKGDINNETLDTIIGGPIEIEEDVHFKRYTKRREHKYTQKELDAFREECKTTLVHDYSEFDRYHISDEERAKNDSLAELSAKLGGLKRIYRKVDQYICAMRVVVEAWEILEKKENFIHSSNEFYQMVNDGRIYHSGILMPKLKGIDKYNMDLLIKYISNPELDPQDLLTKDEIKKRDPFYDEWDNDNDEETEEEEMERLMSPEEIQFILDHEDAPPAMEVQNVKNKFIEGYDDKGFKFNKKKMKKKDRIYAQSMHEILRKIQSDPKNRTDYNAYSRSWLVTSSMFEPVKEEKTFWDKMYYDGSWVDDDAVYLYELAEREAMLAEYPVGETYMTYADKELQEFFKVMESNGVNVTEIRRKMNMDPSTLKNEEAKKTKKENKKVEAALIERITKLNGDPKFKKLVSKAEKKLNEDMSEY